MRLCLVLLLAAAGCSPEAPEAPDVVPVVRVQAGAARAVAVARVLGSAASVRLDPPAGVRARAAADGRLEISADRAGLVTVPFQTDRQSGVLAVHAVGAEGALRLAIVGVEPEHPDVLRFAVTRLDRTGRPVPPGLDDEGSVVALVGDALYPENAVDAFDDYVRLDLDAVGLGRHRLRVAAQVDGLVSNWIGLDLVDGRPARR